MKVARTCNYTIQCRHTVGGAHEKIIFTVFKFFQVSSGFSNAVLCKIMRPPIKVSIILIFKRYFLFYKVTTSTNIHQWIILLRSWRLKYQLLFTIFWISIFNFQLFVQHFMKLAPVCWHAAGFHQNNLGCSNQCCLYKIMSAVLRRVATGGAMDQFAPPIPKVAPKIFRLIKLLVCKPKKYFSANQRNS